MRDPMILARGLSALSRRRRQLTIAAIAACPIVAGSLVSTPAAYGQRVFGLDTSSAANTNAPSQTAWNNAFNDADGDGVAYSFAIVRSSRGGTTTANERLDDSHFYNNITRATAAGMLAGSYHFARADLSPAAGGTNTATDDANHYLERAGMYMKPGFMLPVFDLESGNTQNTTAQLTAWGTEWMNVIKNAIGVYPIVYTSSSYNNDEVTAALAFGNTGTTPKTNPITYQWLARPSGSLQTGDPGGATNYPNPYGVWDPNFVTRTNSRDPAVKPWAFWQNGSGSPNGFLIDYNAANGNIEFVRDFLVPALWTNAGSGDWGTIANWNSNNAGYNGTIASGPAPRLPKYDATNANRSLRAYDWVRLENPGNGTVTISSGAQGVRKFFTQQPLNITGGSLSVNYIPGSGGKWDVPSEFSAAVTMGSGTGYTSYSTQINGGGGVLNVNGGTVTFNSINLASHASNAGKVVIGGNPTFSPYGGAGTAIIRSTGSLAQAGTFDLLGGVSDRTLTVTNGSAAVDVRIDATVTGAPRLIKSGAGTLQLAGTNTNTGGVTVNGGRLRITRDLNLGAVPASATASSIVLDTGGILQTGSTINSVSLTNTSFPTATIGGAGPEALPPVVNVLAGVRTINLTNGGSGYVDQTSAPAANTAGTFVDIVGGGGTGATAFATVAGGVVTGITITNQGTGYTSMPTVWISSTAIGGVDGSGAAATVNGITLQSLSLADAGFDYSSPTITLTGGGGTGATGSITSTSALTLAANRGIQLNAGGGTLNQAAGSTLTASGVVSGTGPLTKDGTGTRVVRGVNTYTGATTINAGTVTATGTAGLGATTGALAVNNTNTGVASAVVLNLSTTAPTTKGSLSGAIAAASSGTNTATINNGGQLFTVNQTTSGTFAGVIAGSGGLSLGTLTTGTLTLSGATTYTGGTTVEAGTLALGASNVLADTGAVSVNGTGTFNIGVNNDTVGVVTLNSGTITGTTGTLIGSSYAVQGGTISGRLGGTGALTKTGPGVFATISAPQSYTGGTNVNAGNLNLATGGSLADTGAVNVNGGTFNVGTVSDTVGVVTLGSGSITGTTGVLTGSSFAVQSGSISAILGGAGAMTKTTAGTVTLSGANTYSGGTTVSAGTLIAANASAFGTDGVTAAAGATARLQAGLSTAMAISTVSTTGTGQFDLTDNSLVVKNSSVAAVQAEVAKGFNGGKWSLAGGINSSTAASAIPRITAIGFASNSVLNKTEFKGVTGLDSDDVLVKYTYYGDSDLSGVVTLNDFSRFLDGYQNAGTTWAVGDYDYSGVVNLDDFSLFLLGYQNQGAPLSSLEGEIESSGMSPESIAAMMAAVQAVPEPASALVALAAGMLGLGTRQRRRRG